MLLPNKQSEDKESGAPGVGKAAPAALRWLADQESALGVSEPYATFIRSGTRVPHPRHWQSLAQLVGISSAADFSKVHTD